MGFADRVKVVMACVKNRDEITAEIRGIIRYVRLLFLINEVVFVIQFFINFHPILFRLLDCYVIFKLFELNFLIYHPDFIVGTK